jgi:hypothetical protein
LVNLHMANMEVLYPKWFDECMTHSKLGDLFVTARINMLDTTFIASKVTKKNKEGGAFMNLSKEQKNILASRVEEEEKKIAA